MHDLVAKQRTYFQTQQTKDIAFRRKQLDTLKQLLNDNEELLYEAIYSDFKKSKFDTYTSELSLLYQDIDDAKKHIYKNSKIEYARSPRKIGGISKGFRRTNAACDAGSW